MMVKCFVKELLTTHINDNTFDPDETIFDVEHYLRMRDFVKMGKRVLFRYIGLCLARRSAVLAKDLRASAGCGRRGFAP